jgi:hypothetical protein
MLHTTTLRSGDDPRHLNRTSVRISATERLASHSMLDRYIEGWAEADAAKITDATAEDYDFHDPLVGHFSRRTLPQYFALLRARFGIAGVAATRDLAFTLRGPMSSASHAARRHYWREAPLLGLTGLAEITVRHGRIVAQEVTYDLNMACEMLRGGGPNQLAPAQH